MTVNLKRKGSSIAAMRLLARRALPRPIFDFADGGAEDEWTLQRNESSIEALPAIVESVAGKIPILVDGGIRRGADVVKALALGARACLIARPQLWGLAVAGEAGVAHVLEIFRSGIDRVMGFCGIGRIADIGPDLLFSANRPERPDNF